MRTDIDLSALKNTAARTHAGGVSGLTAGSDPAARRNQRRLAMQTWAPLAVTGVLASVLGGWFLLPMLEPVSPVQTTPLIVRLTAESAATPTTAVIASGWIEPEPYPTSVPPLVAGVIATLPVVEGTPLVKGETVIATLDTTLIDTDIARQTTRVQLAEADVSLATTRLQNAESLLAQKLGPRMDLTQQQHLMSRLAVERSLLEARVNGLRERVRQNGSARLAVSKLETELADLDVMAAELRGMIATISAEMSYLEQDAIAYEEMAENNAGARLEAVQRRSKVLMAHEQLAAAKLRLAALTTQRAATRDSLTVAREVAAAPTELLQQLKEAEAELSQQQALMDTHKEHLKVAQEGVDQPVALQTARDEAAARLAVAEAELADAQAALDSLMVRRAAHTVVSPVDGEVMLVLAQPGMPVSPLMSPGEGDGQLQRAATALILAFRPAELQARIDMPLGDVPAIGSGQKVEITCESCPGTTFEGTVLRLVRQADIARNTLQVKVRINQPDPRMRPDMLVRARFLPPERVEPEPGSPESAEPKVERWFVPPAALFDDPVSGESVIMIYDPRGKYRGEGMAQRVVVERLGESDKLIEIRATGLSRTHQVILNPAVLRNGARVVRTGEATP